MNSNLEFNANLDDGLNGLPNYDHFARTIMIVRDQFLNHFEEEIMSRIPLLIDNGISHTGYTPIITPVWGYGLIMKLNIEDGSHTARIIFQSAHEFTHYVFFSLLGLDKEKADDTEESLCSAVALAALKIYVPESLEDHIKFLNNLEEGPYKKGIEVAEEVNFDFDKLRKKILARAEELK